MTLLRNFLISPDRVVTNPYYLTWRQETRLAGFIMVTPYCAEPAYKTWNKAAYNRFCGIAHEAYIDDKPAFALPVFVNDQPAFHIRFDGDGDEIVVKDWFAFFKGNDDWHYAMRFEKKSERDKMLEFFGEDLGFLVEDLIVQN